MRIAEYKQIDTDIIESVMPILDDDGNDTGEFETVRKEFPVMGMVYREATPEEIAQAEAAQAEAERQEAMREPTVEERIEAQVMYTALMTDTLLMEE